MTTVHRIPDGTLRAYTKGATENLLARSHAHTGRRHCCTRNHRTADRKATLATVEHMSEGALRVLGCAYRDYSGRPASEHQSGYRRIGCRAQNPVYSLRPEEKSTLTTSASSSKPDLTYVGLVGMIDPPRKEVIGSIEECKGSGIITVMITGDHKDTAFAIAKELGIAQSHDQAISGNGDRRDSSDGELTARTKNAPRVRARVARAQGQDRQGIPGRGKHRLDDGRRSQRRAEPQERGHRRRDGHYRHRRRQGRFGHGADGRQLQDHRERDPRRPRDLRQHQESDPVPPVVQRRRNHRDIHRHYDRHRLAPEADPHTLGQPRDGHPSRPRPVHGQGRCGYHEEEAPGAEGKPLRARRNPLCRPVRRMERLHHPSRLRHRTLLVRQRRRRSLSAPKRWLSPCSHSASSSTRSTCATTGNRFSRSVFSAIPG